jgi:hypothetical protein
MGEVTRETIIIVSGEGSDVYRSMSTNSWNRGENIQEMTKYDTWIDQMDERKSFE